MNFSDIEHCYTRRFYRCNLVLTGVLFRFCSCLVVACSPCSSQYWSSVLTRLRWEWSTGEYLNVGSTILAEMFCFFPITIWGYTSTSHGFFFPFQQFPAAVVLPRGQGSRFHPPHRLLSPWPGPEVTCSTGKNLTLPYCLTRIVSGLRAGFKCEHPSEEKRWAAGFSEKQNQRVNLTKAINSDLLFTATEVIGGKHVIRFDFFCIVLWLM